MFVKVAVGVAALVVIVASAYFLRKVILGKIDKHTDEE